MKTLLETFSISQIVLYTILVLIAFKGVVTFFDWFTSRGVDYFKTKYQKPKQLQQSVENMAKTLTTLAEKVDMLIQSDKDDIKAFITRQHHYFCYQKGWIDDHSLDCIERRFEHYRHQGGNSFIETLMEQIRDLPKQQPKTKE